MQVVRLAIGTQFFDVSAIDEIERALDEDSKTITIDFDDTDGMQLQPADSGGYTAVLMSRRRRVKRIPKEKLSKELAVEIVRRSLRGDKRWEDDIEWRDTNWGMMWLQSGGCFLAGILVLASLGFAGVFFFKALKLQSTGYLAAGLGIVVANGLLLFVLRRLGKS